MSLVWLARARKGAKLSISFAFFTRRDDLCRVTKFDQLLRYVSALA